MKKRKLMVLVLSLICVISLSFGITTVFAAAPNVEGKTNLINLTESPNPKNYTLNNGTLIAKQVNDATDSIATSLTNFEQYKNTATNQYVSGGMLNYYSEFTYVYPDLDTGANHNVPQLLFWNYSMGDVGLRLQRDGSAYLMANGNPISDWQNLFVPAQINTPITIGAMVTYSEAGTKIEIYTNNSATPSYTQTIAEVGKPIYKLYAQGTNANISGIKQYLFTENIDLNDGRNTPPWYNNAKNLINTAVNGKLENYTVVGNNFTTTTKIAGERISLSNVFDKTVTSPASVYYHMVIENAENLTGAMWEVQGMEFWQDLEGKKYSVMKYNTNGGFFGIFTDKGVGTFKDPVPSIGQASTEKGASYVLDIALAANKATISVNGTAVFTDVVLPAGKPIANIFDRGFASNFKDVYVVAGQNTEKFIIDVAPKTAIDLKIGENLDTVTFDAIYSDGTKVTANRNDVKLTGFNLNASTAQNVNISYTEAASSIKIASNFSVTLKDYITKLTAVALKSEYAQGADFDNSKVKITATYKSGKEVELPVSEVTIDSTAYNKTTIGAYTINVNIGEVKTSFVVNVIELFKSISIKAPTKTTYIYGESLDLIGGTVTVINFNDVPTTISLSENMITGFNKNKLGSQKLTVSYKGLDTTFDITVNDLKIKAELSGDIRLNYDLNEAFDALNAEIVITWKSGKIDNIPVTLAMVQNFSTLSAKSIDILLNYTDKDVNTLVVEKNYIMVVEPAFVAPAPEKTNGVNKEDIGGYTKEEGYFLLPNGEVVGTTQNLANLTGLEGKTIVHTLNLSTTIKIRGANAFHTTTWLNVRKAGNVIYSIEQRTNGQLFIMKRVGEQGPEPIASMVNYRELLDNDVTVFIKIVSTNTTIKVYINDVLVSFGSPYGDTITIPYAKAIYSLGSEHSSLISSNIGMYVQDGEKLGKNLININSNSSINQYVVASGRYIKGDATKNSEKISISNLSNSVDFYQKENVYEDECNLTFRHKISLFDRSDVLVQGSETAAQDRFNVPVVWVRNTGSVKIGVRLTAWGELTVDDSTGVQIARATVNGHGIGSDTIAERKGRMYSLEIVTTKNTITVYVNGDKAINNAAINSGRVLFEVSNNNSAVDIYNSALYLESEGYTFANATDDYLKSYEAVATKTNYEVGEAFNSTVVTLNEVWASGKRVAIADAVIDSSAYNADVVGEYLITATKGEFSATVKVNVVDSVKTIIIKTPTKIEYFYGDNFDILSADLTVTSHANVVTTVALSADMLSGYDKNVIGKQTITITYQGVTSTFVIEVKDKVASVVLDTQPTKLTYIYGEDISTLGGKITIYYLSGASKEENLALNMLSGYNSNILGAQSVTITYENIVSEETINVTVNDSVSSISIKQGLAKDTVKIDETIDFTTMKIEVTMLSGAKKTVDVTAAMVSTLDTSSIGEKTVTISYEGKTCPYKITVIKGGGCKSSKSASASALVLMLAGLALFIKKRG